MIPYAKALEKILAEARPLATQRISLDHSLGFYLAQDVFAHESSPRFDQAEMDGYGLRVRDVAAAREDSPVRLPVVDVIRAGDAVRTRLSRGTAVKIFTGARLPPGVEAVVAKERCIEEKVTVTLCQPVRPGANIRYRGEEYARGERVLAKGTAVTPPVVGLLASLGCASLLVHGKPRVALMVTGDELVAPGKPLGPGQIYDSNSYALKAALYGLGMRPLMTRRVRDDPRMIRSHLVKALAQSDVIITVGGVSVGDYDFVKDAAREIGIENVFWRVAIKPGMPNFFGVFRRNHRGRERRAHEHGHGNTLVFGLPGNPVAALVSFHQLVKPALLRLAGQREWRPVILPALLSQEREKKKGRLEWVRSVITRRARQMIAHPADGQKSHMLTGLAAANGLMEFPADRTVLPSKAAVWVHLLSWT